MEDICDLYQRWFDEAWNDLPKHYRYDSKGSIMAQEVYLLPQPEAAIKVCRHTTYGARWWLREAPAPHQLASFLNDILFALASGNDQCVPHQWVKPEGCQFYARPILALTKHNDRQPIYNIVTRQPWTLDFTPDDITGHIIMTVYGRYSVCGSDWRRLANDQRP